MTKGREWPSPLRPASPVVSEHHPTVKPVPLIERAIVNSSQPGDVVLDLFLGSGTTMIAAERTGRVRHGMELSPGYCDVVVARWEAFPGELAEKLEPGPREAGAGATR